MAIILWGPTGKGFLFLLEEKKNPAVCTGWFSWAHPDPTEVPRHLLVSCSVDQASACFFRGWREPPSSPLRDSPLLISLIAISLQPRCPLFFTAPPSNGTLHPSRSVLQASLATAPAPTKTPKGVLLFHAQNRRSPLRDRSSCLRWWTVLFGQSRRPLLVWPPGSPPTSRCPFTLSRKGCLSSAIHLPARSPFRPLPLGSGGVTICTFNLPLYAHNSKTFPATPTDIAQWLIKQHKPMHGHMVQQVTNKKLATLLTNIFFWNFFHIPGQGFENNLAEQHSAIQTPYVVLQPANILHPRLLSWGFGCQPTDLGVSYV